MAGINALSSISNINTANVKTQRTTPYEAQQDFASVLKESINKVNDAQIESDRLTTKLA
ncbi:flagellar hook-basal body complex protein FliE, partial [Peribacillus psychrosaccharolyticus]